MSLDQPAQRGVIVRFGHRADLDEWRRGPFANQVRGVDDECDAAAHARGKVAPSAAEHDDRAAGHVLASVITDAFDDRNGAAVPNREPFARRAGDERFARRRAIQRRVAHDDRAFRQDAGRETLIFLPHDPRGAAGYLAEDDGRPTIQFAS